MKAKFYKRIFAYILDLMIITIIASVVTSFIPLSNKQKTLTKEYNEIVEKASNDNLDVKQYMSDLSNISYKVQKASVIATLITIIIYLLYYVIFQEKYGYTLGKKMMNIRLTTKDGSKLTSNKLMLRLLLNNSVGINFITVLFILFVNQKMYIILSNTFVVVFYIIMVINIIMMIFRKDGKGLHDIVSNTEEIDG